MLGRPPQMSGATPDAMPRRQLLALFFALLAAALVIRWPLLGHPNVHVDEEFYLLVGDRMLHGAVPYVDIWDRKPVGLFIIYAAIRWLGGAGIVQYQLVATLCVAATATAVAALARRVTDGFGAAVTAVVYLIWLHSVGGSGGQTPVLYNLPMTVAAICVLSAFDPSVSVRRIVWRGALGMLLVGLAMQIKYTAVFEGIFFGLALLLAVWRARAPRMVMAGAFMLFVVVALAPTLAALGVYWRMGRVHEFVFANFESFFLRRPINPKYERANLLYIIGVLSPLGACALYERFRRRREGGAEVPVDAVAERFVWGWAASAIAGVLILGTYYDHYALPLVAPMALCMAPVLRHRGLGRRLAVGVVLVGAALGTMGVRRQLENHGTPEQMYQLADQIRPHVGNGLLVFDMLPMLYYLTDSPLLTAYSFPTHLRSAYEADALGVSPVDELRRTLTKRPGVILVRLEGPGDRNAETAALLMETLARDYHRVGPYALGTQAGDIYYLNERLAPR